MTSSKFLSLRRIQRQTINCQGLRTVHCKSRISLGFERSNACTLSVVTHVSNVMPFYLTAESGVMLQLKIDIDEFLAVLKLGRQKFCGIELGLINSGSGCEFRFLKCGKEHGLSASLCAHCFVIASYSCRSLLLIAIRVTNPDHASADVKEEGLPEGCEPAGLREEDKEKPGSNSDEQQAEDAQAESPDQPKLPTPLPPATPPTDDLSQAFGTGLRLDDKSQPPVHLMAMQSSSVDGSSPERDMPNGQPKRPRRPIGTSEMKNLFGTEFKSLPILHSSQGSMPPPQTPQSSFDSGHKRKWKPDAIPSPKSQRPVKRNRGSSTSNADSPVKPFLTRNGLMRGANKSGGELKQAEAVKLNGYESPTKTPVIRRIIIKNQDEIVVDKLLDMPLELSRKVAAPETPKVPSSPVYPLDESVVFSTRKLSDITTPSMKPPQTTQPPTPHASSSPTRKPPPKSRSSSPLKKSQTPTGLPTPVSRLERSRNEKARTQTQQIAELDNSWKMPELSKDCVVSFAQEGPWMTSGNGKGGVWRNVKSARPGSFKETDVLFGVRYVIS